MKRNIFTIGMMALVAFASCKKTNSTEPEKTTLQKVQGKWNLFRSTSNTWNPAGVLLYNSVELGEAGDSIVFKPNSKAYSYETGSLVAILDYQVPNDSTLVVDGDRYRINKITGTELNLFLRIVDSDGRFELLTELKK